MPTICELQIEAKKRGLRGYSKLKKAELEALVNKKESSPPKTMTIKVKKSKLEAIRKKAAPAKTPTPVKKTSFKNAKDLLEWVLTTGVLEEQEEYEETRKTPQGARRAIIAIAKDWIKKNDWKKMTDKQIADGIYKHGAKGIK